MEPSFRDKIRYLVLLVSCLTVPLLSALIGTQASKATESAAIGLIVGEMAVHIFFTYKYVTKKIVLTLLLGSLIALLIMMLGIALSQLQSFNDLSKKILPKDIFYSRIVKSIITDTIIAVPIWGIIFQLTKAIYNKRIQAANRRLT